MLGMESKSHMMRVYSSVMAAGREYAFYYHFFPFLQEAVHWRKKSRLKKLSVESPDNFMDFKKGFELSCGVPAVYSAKLEVAAKWDVDLSRS